MTLLVDSSSIHTSPITIEHLLMQSKFQGYTASGMMTCYVFEIIQELATKVIEESQRLGKSDLATQRAVYRTIHLQAEPLQDPVFRQYMINKLNENEDKMFKTLRQTRICWERVVSGELKEEDRAKYPFAPPFNYEKETGKQRPNFFEVTKQQQEDFYDELAELLPEEFTEIMSLQKESAKLYFAFVEKKFMMKNGFNQIDPAIEKFAEERIRASFDGVIDKIKSECKERYMQKIRDIQVRQILDSFVPCAVLSRLPKFK